MVDYVDQVVDLVLTDLGRKQRDQPADEQSGNPGNRSGDKDDPFVFFHRVTTIAGRWPPIWPSSANCRWTV